MSDKKIVYLLVEVNKEPTNEIEGDDWQPTAQWVANEVQNVMTAYDTDDGYRYGMVQAVQIVPADSGVKASYPYVVTKPDRHDIAPDWMGHPQ
jgi:hypothetical protein